MTGNFKEDFIEQVKNDKEKYGFKSLWGVIFWHVNQFVIVRIISFEKEYFIYEMGVIEQDKKTGQQRISEFLEVRSRYENVLYFTPITDHGFEIIKANESRIIKPKLEIIH